MPTIRDQAFVVRIWDWSETSQTVSLFCRDYGALRGLAKGAKREKSRFSGGFELLTRGEVVAIVKPSTELAALTDWDLQEVFPIVRRDLRAHYTALYIADLARHFVTDSDPHPRLWDAMHATLRALDQAPADAPLALLRFQWNTLVESGHMPDLREASVRPPGRSPAFGFDPAAGRLTSDPGPRPAGDASPPWRVRAETIDALLAAVAAGSASERQTPLGRVPAAPIARAARLLAAYIHWLLARELPTAAPCLAAIDSADSRPTTAPPS